MMINDIKFIMRTDILPSQLTLPSDNWRERPDIDSDDLAKSIASVGLIQPPVIAIYGNNPEKNINLFLKQGDKK